MQGSPQISLQGIPPPFNSPMGDRIQRRCTVHFIRCRISDKIDNGAGARDASPARTAITFYFSSGRQPAREEFRSCSAGLGRFAMSFVGQSVTVSLRRIV